MERGEQSSDRVPAETGFQSGVHFLRTGCLRKSSLPDGKRGADGSQNHFRYPAGLFKRKKFRRAESSSAVKGNEAGKLYRKKTGKPPVFFSSVPRCGKLPRKFPVSYTRWDNPRFRSGEDRKPAGTPLHCSGSFLRKSHRQ